MKRKPGTTLERGVFGHLLVPLDLSQGNERALATALTLALQNRARVTLIHVIQRVERMPMAELGSFYRRLERTASSTLISAGRRFTRRRVPVRAVVLIGDPAREIVRWAEASRVDLIILASHRIEPRHPRWGTTSYKVGILCGCPVLLVK